MQEITLNFDVPTDKEQVKRLEASKSLSSTKSLAPCISAPACSVHKHRPQPPPCLEPEKCYRKSRRSSHRCRSAMDQVHRLGSPCECARVQSRDSRMVSKRRKYSYKGHKRRIKRAYKKRSKVSRWPKKSCGCCTCSIL